MTNSKSYAFQANAVNVNFYFHNSLWCLKNDFMNTFTASIKAFGGNKKKCKSKNLSYFLPFIVDSDVRVKKKR